MSPMTPVQGHGRHTMLRQVASFAPGSLLPAAAALAIAVIFTRIFDSAEFGRYSLMVSVAVLSATLASQWLQQGIGRYLPGAITEGTAADVRAAAAAALTLLIITVAAVALLASAVLARMLPQEWSRLLWPTAALLAGFCLVDTLVVVLQSSMRGARYSAWRGVDALLRLLLGLGAVLLIGRSAQWLLWGTALSPLLLAPLLWRDAGLPSPWRALRALPALRERIARMMSYGVPMVGWFAAYHVLNVSDRYVIQAYRGAGEVGIYAANYSLAAGVSGLMAAPVLLAAHPRLMQAWDAGRTDAAERWLGRIIEAFISLGTLLFGLLLLSSRDVAAILLGVEFREGHLVMAIALAGTLMWQIGLFAQKPLEFTERVRSVFGVALAAAVFNLALNIAFVPRYGYMAAAWSTLASYLFYAVVAAGIGRRQLPWRIRWRSVLLTLGVIVPALAAAAAVRRAAPDSPTALAVAIAIALLTSAWIAHRVMRTTLVVDAT